MTPEGEASSESGWTEVRVEVPVGWGELVADVLAVPPCSTVAFGAPSLATPPAAEGHEYLRAFAPAGEDTEVWRAGVRARLGELAGRAGADELAGLAPRFRRLPAEDWATSWKKTWKPFRVGRLCVVTRDWNRPLRERDVRLVLQPGGVFGTGRHATTRMCLAALEERLAPGATVLDAGCGTGILSVAAALLGALAVTGFDVEENARVHAEGLARDNGVADACTFLTADFAAPEVAEGGFDAVLANIYYDVLQAHAADVARALRPDGWFALSGCPADRLDETLQAVRAAGLDVQEIRARGRWRTMLGTRA